MKPYLLLIFLLVLTQIGLAVTPSSADVTRDARIDQQDLIAVGRNFDQQVQLNPAADLNGNEKIDFYDFVLVAKYQGRPLPSTSNLSLGMRSGSGFMSSFARSDDIYSGSINTANDTLLGMRVYNRMLMTAAMADIASAVDSLPFPISYIGYDLERWNATPIWEQDNPVEAVNQAQQIAHARGLQLVIGPSRYFNENFGTQLAQYTDVYMPQAKAYQAYMNLSEYTSTVRSLLGSIKNANPSVRTWLDLSPTPKDITKTPEDMLECVAAVRDLIDGVWVTYASSEEENVTGFVNLLRG